MYIRKTQDVYTLQGDYGHGHGWEVLTAETTRTEINQRRKEYRENIPGMTLRIIKSRERITPKENHTPRETTMYKIVRSFFSGDRRKRVIKTGLTLAEAQAHCKNPETSSRTATSSKAKAYTRRNGPWFDGYEECRR